MDQYLIKAKNNSCQCLPAAEAATSADSETTTLSPSHKNLNSPAFSLCLSIVSLINYIISGLQIVNRNTLVNAIYKLSSISLANSWLKTWSYLRWTVASRKQRRTNIKRTATTTVWILITFTISHSIIVITILQLLVRPLLFSPYNLNVANPSFMSLETSTDYRLTLSLSFSPGAGLVLSCVLAIYLCGKECISITSWF